MPTQMRGVRLTDDEWNALEKMAIAAGYKDRTAYLVAITLGKEPKPVEKPTPVPAQAPTPTPATPEPAKAVGVCYSFTQAWSALSKHQQNQINGYPGSISAIKAFHAISVGAPTE